MERKSAEKGTKTSATTATGKASGIHGRGTSRDEGARPKSWKEEARASKSKADGERAVLAKIAEMQDRIAPWPSGSHAIVALREPLAEDLVGCPRMPRTARSCYQDAQKFKSKYATFGSATRRTSTKAPWPVAFALTELTAAVEARIGALVKKAVS